MDESLKARLIGATVLVAFAVLLIPELLSGRKTVEPPSDDPAARATRSFTIELEGSTGQVAAPDRPPGLLPPAVSPSPSPSPSPARTMVPEESTLSSSRPPPQSLAEPEPVETTGQTAGSNGSASARSAATTATVAVERPAQTAVEPARGGWSVQVGAFGSADSAQQLVKDLQGAGYPAYVAPVNRAGKTLHRVRVGPQASRSDADRLAGRLKARGLPTSVVAND